MPGGVRGVIFDLGGVVLNSPFPAINKYEQSMGLTPGSITRVLLKFGSSGSMAEFERGQLSFDEFSKRFETECKALGLPDGISGKNFISSIENDLTPNDRMIQVIKKLRSNGIKTAALTNNWYSSSERMDSIESIRSLFDVVVESRIERISKPNPEIYRIACERIGLHPNELAYLDDIGRNLTPARRMGIHTILVSPSNFDKVLKDLESVTGVRLTSTIVSKL